MSYDGTSARLAPPSLRFRMAMMTASELLDRLGDHHVLPASQIEELRTQLPGFSDAHALAKELVERNWLTPDQVNQILQSGSATPDQSDRAAEMTARQLAQALAVSPPVPVGIPIVQAVPVVQAYPVATPVAADTGAAVAFTNHAEQVQDAAGLAMVGQPIAAAVPAATPSRSNGRLFLFGGGAIAILALAGVVIAMMVRGSRPPATPKSGYGPGAALTILPLEPVTFKEGNSKFVIVRIQRKDFIGPVELTVKDPPTGISAQPITFSDKQDINQFRLTVSFGIGAMKTDLRVVAKAENLQAETLLPLTVVTNRNEAVPD